MAFSIVTGIDPFYNQDKEIKAAVAERFVLLLPYLKQENGPSLYDGNRCRPENLGWRFLQMMGLATLSVESIKHGLWDEEIEATWHEAAKSEFYYMCEKDWGD